MSSRDEATLDRLQEVLGARKIDFLFIDGDHGYEGVKYDFDHYLPFVSQNGLVALHDVNLPIGPACEVGKFWKELEVGQHATRAIIGDPPRNMGIGLVAVDGVF
jgi:predicted O-methyltransferase YrrM